MNNRFCRCCFSDHNADDTICRGFLSHLSDNKHSLSSQRSGKRPLDGRAVLSAGAGLLREEPPQKWPRPQQLSSVLGVAGRAGCLKRDLVEGPVESPAQPGNGSTRQWPRSGSECGEGTKEYPSPPASPRSPITQECACTQARHHHDPECRGGERGPRPLGPPALCSVQTHTHTLTPT